MAFTPPEKLYYVLEYEKTQFVTNVESAAPYSTTTSL